MWELIENGSQLREFSLSLPNGKALPGKAGPEGLQPAGLLVT